MTMRMKKVRSDSTSGATHAATQARTTRTVRGWGRATRDLTWDNSLRHHLASSLSKLRLRAIMMISISSRATSVW